MSAFDDGMVVEAESQRVLLPWLHARYSLVMLNAGGRHATRLQRVCDAFVRAGDQLLAVEMKAERTKGAGNFFLESWSNRQRGNPGWFLKSDADVLLYHFLDADELYVLDLPTLRAWAFKDWAIARYPERKQSKRAQANDTWGWCVPLEDCLAVAAMGDGLYAPREELKLRRRA